jgi:hypothetical protein
MRDGEAGTPLAKTLLRRRSSRFKNLNEWLTPHPSRAARRQLTGGARRGAYLIRHPAGGRAGLLVVCLRPPRPRALDTNGDKWHLKSLGPALPAT